SISNCGNNGGGGSNSRPSITTSDITTYPSPATVGSQVTIDACNAVSDDQKSVSELNFNWENNHRVSTDGCEATYRWSTAGTKTVDLSVSDGSKSSTSIDVTVNNGNAIHYLNTVTNTVPCTNIFSRTRCNAFAYRYGNLHFIEWDQSTDFGIQLKVTNNRESSYGPTNIEVDLVEAYAEQPVRLDITDPADMGTAGTGQTTTGTATVDMGNWNPSAGIYKVDITIPNAINKAENRVENNYYGGSFIYIHNPDSNTPPSVSITKPSQSSRPLQLMTGDSYTFEGQASDPDPDGSIATREWYIQGPNENINPTSDSIQPDATGNSLSHTFNSAGSYTIYFRAQDNEGANTVKQVTVNVQQPAQPNLQISASTTAQTYDYTVTATIENAEKTGSFVNTGDGSFTNIQQIAEDDNGATHDRYRWTVDFSQSDAGQTRTISTEV
ncbi:MAG: PKD domain-containing protein, partial [Candidatus Nanohaloarchaea archaeon]|nr:PKD domain-containing protein [Candidatus Nanohaloarchaea archaeon]